MPKFLLILCLFSYIQLFAGNFGFQISLESGFLKEQQEDSQTMLRLIGRFRYARQFDMSNLNIKLRLAPEGYFSRTSSSVLRTSGQIHFVVPRELSRWDFLLSAKHYKYSLLESNKQNYTLIIGGGSYQLSINQKVSIKTDISAICRIIDAIPGHRLTGVRITPTLLIPLKADYSLQTGLHGEPFEIRSEDSINDGWRIGGSFVFKKRRNPLFSFSYRLLFNKNTYQDDLSSEQHFEILLGKSLSAHWSIFFYLNYYLLPEISPETPIELVYTPLNTQNWIYLQTGFDMTKNTEIYSRFGYIYEEVNYGLQTIRGWQILLGVNFSN